MRGYVDLHCHAIPGVDDGVRTLDEAQRVLEGLARLGYAEVAITPHIRTMMFENRRAPLERSFTELKSLLEGARIPTLSLAAEHYFDDVFFGLVERDETLPYRGGATILVEFRYEAWPRQLEQKLFQLQLKGLTPVIAHPERYHALADSTDPLDPLLALGAFTLLDTMSLVGKYGERTKRVAERMLDEGAFDAACSDIHRPDDLEHLERGIARLRSLVGDDDAQALLATHPRQILEGTYAP